MVRTAKGVVFNYCPICLEENDGIVDVELAADGQIYCYKNHKLTGDRNAFEKDAEQVS